MASFDFIKKGSYIVTSDGITAIFGHSFKQGSQSVFRAPFANNIGDNIIRNGVFRISGNGWRFATDDEIVRLKKLIKTYIADHFEDFIEL